MITRFRNSSWIARRSSVLLGLTLLGGGLFVLANAGLARTMSQEEFGLVMFAVATVEFAIVFGLLGMPTVLTRETAAASKSSPALIPDGLRLARKVVMIACVPVAIATTAFLNVTVDAAFISDPIALAAIAVYLLALGQLDCEQGVLRGLRHPVGAALPNQIARPLILMGFAWLMYANMSGGTRTGIVVVATATLLVYCMTRWMAQRNVAAITKDSGGQVTDRHEVAVWLGSGWKMTMASLARNTQQRGTLLMLGTMTSASDVAIFAVCLQLGRVMKLALSSVSNVASPIMAVAVRTGDMEGLQRAYSQSVRWAATVGIIVALGIGLGGHMILQLYGTVYAEAYGVLLVVLAARLLASLTGPTGTILNMGGDEGALMKILWLGGIASLVIGFFLIPGLGALGAAWAMFAGIAVSNLWMLLHIKKRHGLSLRRALLGI